jgi:hypothetical protein
MQEQENRVKCIFCLNCASEILYLIKATQKFLWARKKDSLPPVNSSSRAQIHGRRCGKRIRGINRKSAGENQLALYEKSAEQNSGPVKRRENPAGKPRHWHTDAYTMT